MAKKRPSPAPKPGALLRAKRRENDWSVADVARALCLAERQLHALEADDYARLPGRAYILGYWQNYANLLGLGGDAAVAAAIEAHKPQLQQGARLALRAESRRAHGSLETARRRWALAFGALAAVFIASLWLWRGADDGVSTAQPAPSPQAEWRRWPGAEPPAPAQNGDSADSAAVADASVLPEPNFPEAADDFPQRHSRSLLSGNRAPAQNTAGVTGGSAGVTGGSAGVTGGSAGVTGGGAGVTGGGAGVTVSRHAPLSRHARDSLSRHARDLLSGRATVPETNTGAQ